MTLSTDFIGDHKPVYMVELDFDSASINFWTRPFTGQANGKTYRPLAGFTGSLSTRQSLDRPNLSATAQISGSSNEIRAAALTEEFQLRQARIRLGAIGSDGEISSSETVLLGKMQDITLTDDANDGVQSNVSMESVFAELTVARDLRYTKADQATFDPNDTFFDFVESAQVTEPRFGS